MPPGDTIILNSFEELPDSIRQLVDSLRSLHGYPDLEEKKGPQYLFPEWFMFLLVFAILAVSAYFYIIKPGSAIKRRVKKFLKGDSLEGAATVIQYDHWLSKHNPYYHSLPQNLKKRFLRRTVAFCQSKEFRYHYMETEEKAPVLISAAAVQLTFGFSNFLLEYFPVINVVKKEYTISKHGNVLEGHVSNRSISVSWNIFIEDFADYTDSQNLGLHELAHAVSFDMFYGNNESWHAAQKQRINDYVQEAVPVFRELCQGKPHILDNYASVDFEEFWAVCVETFFENAEDFRSRMPGLYDAICDLLNQDPLREEKIINKAVAGL